MRVVLILITIITSIYSTDQDPNKDHKKSKIEMQIEKQMSKEQKYAREQTFYHGDDYDLKSYEVDPDSLPDVPSIKPEYDFDMSEGVYSD